MPAPDASKLRLELAAAAARFIAEEGLDYAGAKRKAAAHLPASAARGALPDNALIEQELRRYLATFMPEQREDLRALRDQALAWMRRLERFRPHLIGAVLNGTATRHSDIRLQLFVDSAKEVEMFLLDLRLAFETADSPGPPDGPLETLFLVARPDRTSALGGQIGIVLEIFETDAIRVAPKNRSAGPDLHPVEASGRASASMLERLVAQA